MSAGTAGRAVRVVYFLRDARRPDIRRRVRHSSAGGAVVFDPRKYVRTDDAFRRFSMRIRDDVYLFRGLFQPDADNDRRRELRGHAEPELSAIGRRRRSAAGGFLLLRDRDHGRLSMRDAVRRAVFESPAGELLVRERDDSLRYPVREFVLAVRVRVVPGSAVARTSMSVGGVEPVLDLVFVRLVSGRRDGFSVVRGLIYGLCRNCSLDRARLDRETVSAPAPVLLAGGPTPDSRRRRFLFRVRVPVAPARVGSRLRLSARRRSDTRPDPELAVRSAPAGSAVPDRLSDVPRSRMDVRRRERDRVSFS